MAEHNYKFEEMYLDDLDYQVRNTYFSNWEAAANYMQLKIEEYMRLNRYYECYITLIGEVSCPQLAQYRQHEDLR